MLQEKAASRAHNESATVYYLYTTLKAEIEPDRVLGSIMLTSFNDQLPPHEVMAFLDRAIERAP